MLVYRVENKKGAGPFSGWSPDGYDFFSHWYEDLYSHDELVNLGAYGYKAGNKVSKARREILARHGEPSHGIRPNELDAWFPERVRGFIGNKGDGQFGLAEYEVPDDSIEVGHFGEIVFDKHKAKLIERKPLIEEKEYA